MKVVWFDTNHDPFNGKWLDYYFMENSSHIECVWIKSMSDLIKHVYDNWVPDIVFINLNSDEDVLNCALWIVDYCLDNNLKIPLIKLNSNNRLKYLINNIIFH